MGNYWDDPYGGEGDSSGNPWEWMNEDEYWNDPSWFDLGGGSGSGGLEGWSPGSWNLGTQPGATITEGQGSGFWNALSKVLFGEQAPGTTGKGTSGALSSLAQGLGNYSKGASTGRLAEANTDTDRYRALASMFGTQQNAAIQKALAELQQREAAATLPAARMSNAARGSLMANAQDVTVTHPRANVVHFTGSPRPSMLTPESRELGKLVSQQMLAQQQTGSPTGDVFEAIKEYTPPTLPDVPEAGWLEQGGSWLAPILAALSTYQQTR